MDVAPIWTVDLYISLTSPVLFFRAARSSFRPLKASFNTFSSPCKMEIELEEGRNDLCDFTSSSSFNFCRLSLFSFCNWRIFRLFLSVCKSTCSMYASWLPAEIRTMARMFLASGNDLIYLRVHVSSVTLRSGRSSIICIGTGHWHGLRTAWWVDFFSFWYEWQNKIVCRFRWIRRPLPAEVA